MRLMKRVTSALANGFIYERYVEAKKRIFEPAKELTFYDQVELVKCFYHLEGRLNASVGSEAAVIARTKIGWISCRECGELHNGRRLLLKMKGRF